MARPTRSPLTRRQQVAEMGESGGYNVVAPLRHLRARSNSAERANALVAALGLGSQIAVAREERKIARLPGEFAAGERDARTGQVDDERRRVSDGYAIAAEQVEAEALVADDATEIEDGVKDLIAAGDVDGVRAFLAEQGKKRWNGLSDVQASVVLPEWAAMEERLTDAARTQARKAAAESNYANLNRAAEAEHRAAREEGRPVDWLKLNGQARALFGAEANTVLTDVAARLVESDPNALVDMPDEWAPGIPSLKHIPDKRSRLEAAAAAAHNRRAAEDAAANSGVLFANLNRWNGYDREGRLIPETDVKSAVELGVLTPAQGASILDQNRRAVEAHAKSLADRVDLTQDILRGTLWRHGGAVASDTQKDGFDAVVLAGASAAGKLDDQGQPDLTDGAAVAWVMDLSQKNQMAHRPTKQRLSSPNLSNAEAFGEQLNIYSAMAAVDPTTTKGLYVPDNDTRSLYDAASTMRKLGYSDAQILERIRTTDFTRRQESWATGTTRQKVLDKLDKMEFDEVGRFFDPDLGGLKNPRWLRREAVDIADQLWSTGVPQTAEELLQMTQEALAGRYVVVGGVAVPNTGDIPQDADRAVKSFLSYEVPEILKELKVDALPSRLELRPDTRTAADGQTLVLVDTSTGENVLPAHRLTLAGIVGRYRDRQTRNANNGRASAENLEQAVLSNSRPRGNIEKR